MNNVCVVVPECSDDDVSALLLILTKIIVQSGGARRVGGFLGGEFGYGCEFSNDVFEMFPYYWGDCTCGAEETYEEHKDECPVVKPNFLHKESGASVNWYKYIGRGMELSVPPNNRQFDWFACLNECIQSVKR